MVGNWRRCTANADGICWRSDGWSCTRWLEDSLYISRGKLAKSNSEQVAKMVRILGEQGNEPATPDEARQILGLKGSEKVKF